MSTNPPSKSMKDFVLGAADQLERKVVDLLAPQYMPGEENEFVNEVRKNCEGHGKTPFAAQMDSLCAIMKGFKSGLRCVSLVAEMGCGKTLLGCFTTLLLSVILKRPARALVLCPPTLISTWKKELKSIFGNKVNIVSANGPEALYLLTKARAERTLPDKPEFWIMGFNRAKTSFSWGHAGIFRSNKIKKNSVGKDRRLTRSCCVHCCAPIDWDAFRESQRNFCPKCKAPLFGPANRRNRYAPALYIKKYLKGYFDILIPDEIHKLKGGNTIQGAILGQLASSCRYILPLTGTLSGGKASEIFYLIQRVVALNFPKEIRKKILPGFNEKMSFVSQFGCLEEIFTHYDSDKVSGRASRENKTLKEKPGISPLILKQFFLPSTVFLRIADIADEMPPYEEELEFCNLPSGLLAEYKSFETDLTDAAKEALKNKDMTVMGKMLSTLLAWPDVPKEIEITNRDGEVVASAPGMGVKTGKDERLIEVMKENKAEGRKVLIFAEYTGKWATDTILASRLRAEGFNPLVLKSNTVKTDQRLDWIEDKMEQGGYDCMICQPQLVEVGLNLLMFPEVIFYQTGYSTYVLRQAARRSWRPSQTQYVRVRFFINCETLQEQAMTLIASKFEASLVLEGELSDRGLVALSEGGDSMGVELARALVGDLKLSSLEKTFAAYRAADSKVYGNKSKKTQKVASKVEAKPSVDSAKPDQPKAKPKTTGTVLQGSFRTVGSLSRLAGKDEATGKVGRRKIRVKVEGSELTIGSATYHLMPAPSLPGFEAWDIVEAA